MQERKEAYEAIKRHPNYYDPTWRKQAAKERAISWVDQSRRLTELQEMTRPEYKEIRRAILTDVLQRLDKAFQAFFRRVKIGQTPGYPRFQGKGRYDSFTTSDLNSFSLTEDKQLCIAKIGSIKVKLHRPIEGQTKTCTIKREGTYWYVVLACEIEQELVYHPSEEAVGIDLGLLHFATPSTGKTIENPRHYRRAEKRLQKLQQVLSLKKRGALGTRRHFSRGHTSEQFREKQSIAERQIGHAKHKNPERTLERASRAAETDNTGVRGPCPAVREQGHRDAEASLGYFVRSFPRSNHPTHYYSAICRDT